MIYVGHFEAHAAKAYLRSCAADGARAVGTEHGSAKGWVGFATLVSVQIAVQMTHTPLSGHLPASPYQYVRDPAKAAGDISDVYPGRVIYVGLR